MTVTIRHLILVAGAAWLTVWTYVGWRGFEMTSDVHGFLRMLPPGARGPDAVLAALEAGQSYIRLAVNWGALVPLCLLLSGWLLKPYLRDRR